LHDVPRPNPKSKIQNAVMFLRLGFGLGLFAGSLLLGWWLGRRGLLTDTRAQGVIRFVVKRLSPVVLCLSFWRLELTGLQPVLLPLIGGLVSLLTLLPALGYARAAKLTRPQTGSFLTCAMFSNLGFFGAFIAFALFGEVAYGLAMLYVVSFSPCFYLVGFGLAKRFGQSTHPASSPTGLADELRLYPFVGLCLGLVLGLVHVPRPAPFELVNHVLIPIDTMLYLMAIGSQLRVEPIGPWLAPCLTMSLIKFGYSPLVGWGLASLFHVEGLSRFIVLLQTAMPVAISPLMLPLLFGLDRQLAVALWVFTTLLAIPWLFVYLPLIS
jgi:predicted permease